jgi:hypothetical protein
VLGALGLRVFKPIMRRVFEHDLDLLKKLVESESNANGGVH